MKFVIKYIYTALIPLRFHEDRKTQEADQIPNKMEVFSKISSSSVRYPTDNCGDRESSHLSLTFSEVYDTDGCETMLDTNRSDVDTDSQLGLVEIGEEFQNKVEWSDTLDNKYETAEDNYGLFDIRLDLIVKDTKIEDIASNKDTEQPVRPVIKTCLPGGLVGLFSIPTQVYRMSLRKGFEFCLMAVGQSGLGKSTLVNSMFLTDIYSRDDRDIQTSTQTVEVEVHKVVLEEEGVKLVLTVIDTPGFGDQVNNSDCWSPIISYVEEQFNKFLESETKVNRIVLSDTRVHALLYFIAPSGRGLTHLDVEFMKRLQEKVNIIPVLGKSDVFTKEELSEVKSKVTQQLGEANIKVYQFPLDEQKEDNVDKMYPFAIIGSNTVIKDESGKLYRGRRYPWGTVNIEDTNHCDFLLLRKLLVAEHMQDLKDVTSEVHYEKFRRDKLIEMGAGGTKNLIAALEDVKMEHQKKIETMSQNMEDVFQKKVDDKQKRMEKLEIDELEKINRERLLLNEERNCLNRLSDELRTEKAEWEKDVPITVGNKFSLRRSTESLDSKKKKLTLSISPFKFGRS